MGFPRKTVYVSNAFFHPFDAEFLTLRILPFNETVGQQSKQVVARERDPWSPKPVLWGAVVATTGRAVSCAFGRGKGDSITARLSRRIGPRGTTKSAMDASWAVRRTRIRGLRQVAEHSDKHSSVGARRDNPPEAA